MHWSGQREKVAHSAVVHVPVPVVSPPVRVGSAVGQAARLHPVAIHPAAVIIDRARIVLTLNLKLNGK